MTIPKLRATGVLLALALGLCCAAPEIESPRKLVQKLIRENDDETTPAPGINVDDIDRPTLYLDEPNVTLKGKWMHTLYDRKISAFEGIQYADVTQRFKHSKLLEFPGVTDQEVMYDQSATKCVQKSMVGGGYSGSENCLYLNVFLPEEPGNVTDIPVMVFIHGGSFTSGDLSLYQPTRLLDHDVILVTVAYRLGALGWLAAQTEDFPGNAGLSDQMNALRWVQENIEIFGGNPDRVTLFGESAGAVSTSLIQTVAPKEEQLFSSVIVESGSALEYWAIDPEPVDSFYTFAETCGCQLDSYLTIRTCLYSKEPEELAECTHSMVGNERMEGNLGFAATSPVVQTKDVGEEQLLINKMPIEYILNWEANDVPMIMGANRDEGSLVLGEMYLGFLEPNGLVNDSYYLENQMVSDILNAIGLNDPTRAVAGALQKNYFRDTDMSTFEACVPGAMDMLGVLFLKGGTYETALYHSQYYNSSTYFYSFDFVSGNSMFDWFFSGDSEVPFEGGVTHADEMMYIFSFPTNLTDAQRRTSKRLTKLWTNFATYHNPTPEDDDDDLELGTWKELDPIELQYYLIQENCTVESDYTKRWNIEMDLNADTIPTNPPTDGPEGPTEPTSAPIDPSEYDKVKQERDDFLITMCVFIVAFVVAECAAVYFWFKARG